jgi:hypothetical protein
MPQITPWRSHFRPTQPSNAFALFKRSRAIASGIPLPPLPRHAAQKAASPGTQSWATCLLGTSPQSDPGHLHIILLACPILEPESPFWQEGGRPAMLSIQNPPRHNPLPAAQTVKDLPGPYRKRVPPPTLFSLKLLKINKISFLVFFKLLKIKKLFFAYAKSHPHETKNLRFHPSSPSRFRAHLSPQPNPAPALEPSKSNRPASGALSQKPPKQRIAKDMLTAALC